MTEETKLTEETKTKSEGFMGIIALILGVGGVYLSYDFIFRFLTPILSAETDAAQECAATAPFYIPAFATIGIIGGILWLMASVGFFQKKKWAYAVSVYAVIISLFANMWPNIPAMESKAAIPGPWFLIFVPNLVVYFYLVQNKGKSSVGKTYFGLVVGMAFILNFINAIAATTRMVNRLPETNAGDFSGAYMYMLTMPTHMIASALFGVAAVGMFLAKKKEWVRMVGLGAAFMGIVAGFPLAYYSTFIHTALDGLEPAFSMFTLGPVMSLLAGFVYLFPSVWKKLMDIKE
ncbi:MAG: hypothetical protein ACTSRK_11620 [Promethearchaeota archaeon]